MARITNEPCLRQSLVRRGQDEPTTVDKANYEKKIDPAERYNEALEFAANYGHIRMIKSLLTKKEENPELYRDIDPAAGDNYAIKFASLSGHDEMVELLLKKKGEKPDLYEKISLK